MSETRAQLLSRKDDIFQSIHLLEQDRGDGTLDDDAYVLSRQRYEHEAASILEKLDALSGDGLRRPEQSRNAGFPVKVATAVTILGVAVTLFLLTALHNRGRGGVITGSQPASVSTPAAVQPAQLMAAMSAVEHHPRSVNALLDLGNAYLNAGDTTRADQSYIAAIRIDPRRPEALTLHAFMLASSRRYSDGLTLLRVVERSHPRYAHAWLLDGLLASRRPPGYTRAIASWERFLKLQPHAVVSRDVRVWIRNLQRLSKATR